MIHMLNNNDNPIVFLASVFHPGGSIHSTLALMEELNKTQPLLVLDFYGYSAEYINELQKRNIKYEILLPDYKNPIIGNDPIKRYWRMLCFLPEFIKITRKLRQILNIVKPRAVWFNSERSMFALGRAVGNKYPTVFFVRGRLPKPRFICLKDWKNLSLILGNNSNSLDMYRRFSWSKDKLGVVYNGIDLNSLKGLPMPKSEIPGINAKYKIIMPATLIPLKAHSVAIKGFAKFCEKHSDTVLWICGDTPNKLPLDYEKGLITLSKNINVADKIYFLGWRSDVLSVMKLANVMILTSETEGFPRSILEAMALGIPVISTAVGGIPELITNGKNGFLIEAGDSDALCEKLEKLREKELREKIGQSGLDRVLNEFTIEKQTKLFIDYINHINTNGFKTHE